MNLRAAVIPTHDRFTDFLDCFDAIAPQVDHIVVIDHHSGYATPKLLKHRTTGALDVIPWAPEQPNLSAMWNAGIRLIRSSWGESVDIAVLNDDAIVPLNWFERLAFNLGGLGGSLACFSELVARPFLHDKESPRDILTRLQGYAFIISGDTDLEADEQFQWWWGDTDLDFRARELGGTLVLPGVIEHRHPNSTTVGKLAEVAGEDRSRFVLKWGSAPW